MGYASAAQRKAVWASKNEKKEKAKAKAKRKRKTKKSAEKRCSNITGGGLRPKNSRNSHTSSTETETETETVAERKAYTL